jgi:hypothetical protein
LDAKRKSKCEINKDLEEKFKEEIIKEKKEKL